MKLANGLVAAMILAGTLDAGAASVAGGDKSNQRGGKAAEHASANGALNTNAQWSADPERGWVRADERHQQQKSGSSVDPKKAVSNGKSKGKVKGSKS